MARPSNCHLPEDAQYHADDISFQLVELIEARMTELKWTRSDLCRESGLAIRNVYRLLSGKTMSISTFARLLAALDLPVDVVRRL